MNNFGMKFFSLMIFVAICLPAAAVYGTEAVFHTLENAKWGPSPPALPPGSQTVILSGNPMENTAFVLVVKMPANYRIPAHSHPKDENVIVISGTVFMGMGDKLDTTGGTALGPGGYALMPGNMNHYLYTEAETVLMVHGQGPVEFSYVNPADDPRNKK